MRPDQERLRTLLTETVTLLCKNGLPYATDLKVQGLLGITMDENDVFVVHINEQYGKQGSGDSTKDHDTTAAFRQVVGLGKSPGKQGRTDSSSQQQSRHGHSASPAKPPQSRSKESPRTPQRHPGSSSSRSSSTSGETDYSSARKDSPRMGQTKVQAIKIEDEEDDIMVMDSSGPGGGRPGMQDRAGFRVRNVQGNFSQYEHMSQSPAQRGMSHTTPSVRTSSAPSGLPTQLNTATQPGRQQAGSWHGSGAPPSQSNVVPVALSQVSSGGVRNIGMSQNLPSRTMLPGELDIMPNRKAFQCDVPGCDKSFSFYSALYTHRKNIHNLKGFGGARRRRPVFPCPYPGCNKAFSIEASLYVHKNQAHGSPGQYDQQNRQRFHPMTQPWQRQQVRQQLFGQRGQGNPAQMGPMPNRQQGMNNTLRSQMQQFGPQQQQQAFGTDFQQMQPYVTTHSPLSAECSALQSMYNERANQEVERQRTDTEESNREEVEGSTADGQTQKDISLPNQTVKKEKPSGASPEESSTQEPASDDMPQESPSDKPTQQDASTDEVVQQQVVKQESPPDDSAPQDSQTQPSPSDDSAQQEMASEHSTHDDGTGQDKELGQKQPVPQELVKNRSVPDSAPHESQSPSLQDDPVQQELPEPGSNTVEHPQLYSPSSPLDRSVQSEIVSRRAESDSMEEEASEGSSIGDTLQQDIARPESPMDQQETLPQDALPKQLSLQDMVELGKQLSPPESSEHVTTDEYMEDCDDLNPLDFPADQQSSQSSSQQDVLSRQDLESLKEQLKELQ